VILQKILKLKIRERELYFAIIFLTVREKKNEKVEFCFDPKDDSLKVSAKSVEKSGYGYDWVKS